MIKVYSDGIFNSKWLSKFINQWFFVGQQQKVERLVYLTFFWIKKKLLISPLFFFFESLEKLKPILGLKIYKKKHRKEIKMRAIPYILPVSLRYKKALQWLISAIKIQAHGNLKFKIFKELFAVNFFKNSLSQKKKKEYYKYAVLYKKNSQFKW